MQHQNLLQDILSADNTARSRAESEFEQKRTSDPAALLQLFLGNLSNADEAVAQMSCVLFKKYFLDNEKAHEIPATDLEQMVNSVLASINFE